TPSHSRLIHTTHHLLFFSPSRPHPDLHSFPTRRSSDLDRGRESGQLRGGRTHFHVFAAGSDQQYVHGFAALRRRAQHAEIQVHRSEEHTSELQSPCNLVCRLLLEKKKKQITHELFQTRV